MLRSPEIVASLPVKTNHGIFIAHYSEAGLAGLDFPKSVKGNFPLAPADYKSAALSGWHRLTTNALQGALANESIEQFPPLDLRVGTEFQQQVWNALRKIPRGSTVSYGELAASLRNAKAVRAVGSACGANPIPVLIPCHRVLAANKKIGGFSGGLDWKRRLLNLENSGIFEG